MKTTAHRLGWLTTLAIALTILSLAPAANAAALPRTGHREGIDRKLSERDLGASSTNQITSEPKPKWHTVAMPRSPHVPVIHWYDKINPVWWLGNAEEPVPPPEYQPTNSMRKVKWYFRNPFTNLSYYVIGVADKDTFRSGRYPTLVGNPHGGWNFAVTRRRIVYLPFMDYKNRHMEFYFGWRERGNFGIKLVFHKKPEKLKP